ncbi:MAG: hypothetical protein ABI581_08195 [Sediminibacterium sp.]
MPTLYILGGPDGSGKTTWYNEEIKNNRLDKSIACLDVDRIIFEELGSFSERNLDRANVKATLRLWEHLKHKQDVLIEANLLNMGQYLHIERMKSVHGYNAVLLYIGTGSMEINLDRISQRISEGGHPAKQELTQSKFDESFDFLQAKLSIFSSAYLYDNSGKSTVLMANFKDGRIYKSMEPNQWVSKIIDTAKINHEQLKKSKSILSAMTKPAKSTLKKKPR